MTGSNRLIVQTTDAVIGARVTGLSLAEIPDSKTVKLVDEALEKHGVLIFPEQEISPQQQVAFSAEFAPLEVTELEKARLEGVEEIFVVGNVGKGLVSFAPQDEADELEWHTDHIHREIAARASLLYAIEVPAVGGDTLFACMYHAFDALTDDQKQAYCKIQTINSGAGLERYLDRQKLTNTPSSTGRRSHDEVIRPLVRAHPDTGRKALYFGNQITTCLVGESESKSLAFIKKLTRHACQPSFQYRHKWAEGDAVLWDNRRLLHAGTPYDVEKSRRLMHRTTWRETETIELTN